ncbi:MAM domain-containing glycosylphosphatidylinositol anchor protein 1 isoform X2 [Anabrus simplex]|uniref:MAM domain-containing glycosylphosphatidylinositol anchor protein 1 isoform X2 n=1 Tax=Anabrus simplex TaxID=316456 RepID=UPI0035A2F111
MRAGSSQWMISSSLLWLMTLLGSTCPNDSLNTHTLRHIQHDSTLAGGDPEVTLNTTTEETTTFLITTTALPPMDVMVRLHHDARLRCDLYKDSRPRINPTWRHSDQLIVDDTTVQALAHRYLQDPLNGQLHIANVRLEDGGLWQCEEIDPETGQVLRYGQAVNLIVTEPPKSLYFEVDGRRLDPGNVFLPVVEDAALSVWCVVEGGHPAPKVSWRLLLSNPAPPLVLNTTTSEDPHQHVRSEARLTRVLRAHHNATITCLVYHVTLPQPLNASLLLDVQYTPSFVITREPGFGIPLIEGIAVSLKCDVDSNPPSNPVWLKDDGAPPIQQSLDGYLNFSSIRRDHSGWYKCTSREYSSIGYFLNVRYEEDAHVSIDPETGEATNTGRQVEVALGGAVQLQCPSSGGVSCWSRVGAGGKLEPIGIGPELSLERVLYQEAGTYRCIRGAYPKLEEWRSLVKVDVSVTGVPAVYPSNKTVTAIAGQRVTLTVEYCANPAADRTIWLTDRILLRPGESNEALIAHNITEGSSPHCHKTALTLRTVRPADAGDYVFLVRSPKGLAEGSVMVNVTTASGFSVTPARGQHLAPTAILYITSMLLASYCRNIIGVL